jgi:hypothetical protein
MTRFVVGDNRSQSTLFPERLDDYLGEDNPVRAVDVFVDDLDLAELGLDGVEPEATGRPAPVPRRKPARSTGLYDSAPALIPRLRRKIAIPSRQEDALRL